MRRSLVTFAVLLAAVCTIAGIATGQPTSSATGSAPVAVEHLAGLERGLLDKLNALRASRGLRRVTLSRPLQAASLAHSRSMLESGYFAHESRDGSSFATRVRRYYSASGYRTWSVGENLIFSSATITPPGAIDAWLASPAHRANMLAPGWREVGIGALHADAAGGTFSGRSTWVITMDFGARSATG